MSVLFVMNQFITQHMVMHVAQLWLTLCDPVDYSLTGSSVHVLSHFSHVLLFLIPWTVAHHGDSPGKNTGVCCHALLQGPLSMGLSKQEF